MTMQAEYQYANPYVYEAEDAECLGGPLDGQRIPVRGTHVYGPFSGRYDLNLIGKTKPSGQIVVVYRYEYDIAWKPSK